jgi:hypothetical protein
MNAGALESLAMVVVAFFVGAAILTPVLALSARFALKPVMETWMRLRASQTSDQEKIMQDRRIALLEAELQGLQQQIQQSAALHEFDQKLVAPPPSERED